MLTMVLTFFEATLGGIGGGLGSTEDGGGETELNVVKASLISEAVRDGVVYLARGAREGWRGHVCEEIFQRVKFDVVVDIVVRV